MATGGVDIDDSRPIMGGSNLFEPDDVAADDSEGDADGMDMITETKVACFVYFWFTNSKWWVLASDRQSDIK